MKMQPKYQIFVSSTYEDLKEERDIVIKAILEIGHIPVGMEMFSAADEEQWELIKRQIKDCDYYIVILAHRYGSLDGDISYTEKEYDFASSINIPRIGFVIDEKAEWDRSRCDTESNKIEKLNNFKNKVKSRVINFWKDKNDLYAKVAISLGKQFTVNPQVGWIKANNVQDNTAVLAEITRLSEENNTLKRKLDEINQLKENRNAKKSEFDELINVLKNHKILSKIRYADTKDYQKENPIPILDIFQSIASSMLVENDIDFLATYIAFYFKEQKEKELGEYPYPKNFTQQIMLDLQAYGLVSPSNKKHPVSDRKEYWSITKKGNEFIHFLRRKQIEASISQQ